MDISNGEDVYINGETSRDFTYIDNVVQANIMTTNTEAFAKAYNTAAGGRETLNNLFNAIKTGLESNVPGLKIKEPIYRAGDIRHSNANINQAKTLLGYEPTLKESLSWYINGRYEQ